MRIVVSVAALLRGWRAARLDFRVRRGGESLREITTSPHLRAFQITVQTSSFCDNAPTFGETMDAPVKALNTEKAKALQAALAQIEKQFGKGSIMRLGEGEVIEDIEVVSTGSLGLDIALGVGGLPRGRVVEIYGPRSAGKASVT